MKICYLDESGHCGKKYDSNQPTETIVGVTTDITKLFKTQKEHGNIIETLSEADINSKELKAAEIYRGRNDWKDVSSEFRDKVYEYLLNWAVERTCKFIVCPIDSKKFFEEKKKNNKLCNKFNFPYEAAAFNSILAVQREFRNKKNNKGRTVMIFDEQKEHDKRLLSLLEEDISFTDTYTGYKKPPRKKAPPRLDQIIDIPHFSKSHMSVVIQIADIAAYVVNRYIQLTSDSKIKTYEGELKKIKKWYKIIGDNIITHTSIEPPGKDELIKFYKNMRPNNWSAKGMKEVE